MTCPGCWTDGRGDDQEAAPQERLAAIDSALAPEQALFVKALLLRASYGGMQVMSDTIQNTTSGVHSIAVTELGSRAETMQ